MFTVHRSNHMEELVEVLAEIVRRPPADPFARECVVVQGRGMERWLAMELSKRLGVWANPDFPFPRHIIDRAMASVLDDAAEDARFAPEALTWSIAALLGELVEHPALASVRAYLADDPRRVKLAQLAERIADTFDRYAVYRPAMVRRWEKGESAESDGWQPLLWRALVQRHGGGHAAARAERFLAAIVAGARPDAAFPSRLCVFGVSTLPPSYVELLAAIGDAVETHVFVLSPSREYWGEIRSRRESIRAQSRAAKPEAADDLHLEIGNPLLASLGRLGRHFQQLLEATTYADGEERYRDPGTGTMLAALQSDILNLRARGTSEHPPIVLVPGDSSIAVHACHGPMREVEVLYDQLLALFEDDEALEPRDVVVMSPSIEAYAPFIDAVFGAEERGAARIPYRIADRSPRAEDPVFEALDALLGALGGRMTAPEVLDLLGLAAVRARFGIAPEELEKVRRWVTESGIRWGIDAAHREEVGQPASDLNTWKFGLERLLLGYAMPGEDGRFLADVLPYDDVEGASADLLGRLAEFATALFRFRGELAGPMPLGDWRDAITRLAAAMLVEDPSTAFQHRQVRAALGALAARAEAARFSAPVDVAVVRRHLEIELGRSVPTHAFLSGGVTFCELVPMRSIPFRVVCLVGMSDDAFPRSRRPPDFDLIARSPQVGDRTLRDDDRYLFLEALLSARERLLITYAGQSIRDDSERPPSVAVSELLDAIGASFRLGADDPDGERARSAVVLRHPLHPFSPRYFGADPDPRLFSHAASYCDGARRLVRAREAPRPFFSLAPDAAAADEKIVELDDLVGFFENPSRFLLQRRVGLYLARDLEPVAIREPLHLDGLERWRIGDEVVRRLVRDDRRAVVRQVFAARGVLPPSLLGEHIFADILADARPIANAAHCVATNEPVPSVEIDEQIGEVRVHGVLRDLWPGRQARVGFAMLGARAELSLWIRHLFLSCRYSVSASTLVGRSKEPATPALVSFHPVRDPRAILASLLDLYRAGCRAPLAFFPRTSRVYVEELRSSGDPARALRKAEQEFEPRGYEGAPSEGDDRYVRQLHGEKFPLADFAAIAVEVFEPLLSHRVEGLVHLAEWG